MFIELKEVTFSYEDSPALKEPVLKRVSFSIWPGEFVSIIGPTASGKSTLLQHLNGLLEPTEGDILIGGKVLGKEISAPEARRLIGLVFQSPENQLFEETVFDDVAFALRNRGLEHEEIEEGVKRAMSQVGLDYDSFKDRSPFALSGGEMRRVAIAGVLAMEPKCLVLDEPTSGLDPFGKRQLLNLFKELNERFGITVIFVTHDMDEAARVSERVIILNRGEVALAGSPAEVFEKAEVIIEIGLELPGTVEMARELAKRGLKVGTDLFERAELARAIVAQVERRPL